MQDVALVADHVRFTEPPALIDVLSALNVTVGAGVATTGGGATGDDPPPHAVNAKSKDAGASTVLIATRVYRCIIS